jgi:hypothetical protein
MVMQNLVEPQHADATICIEMQGQEVYFAERPAERKSGINVFTAENVKFKLDSSIVPDHFAISLATVYVTLDDVPDLSVLFSNAYAAYFAKIAAILRCATNIRKVCEEVEKICMHHFQDTRKFFTWFSGSVNSMDYIEKTLKMWIQPFIKDMDSLIAECTRSRADALGRPLDLNSKFTRLELRISRLRSKLTEAQKTAQCIAATEQAKEFANTVADDDAELATN